MKSDLQTPLDLEEIDFSHIPVLSQEVITGLNIQAGGNYLDLTIGGGGHSRLILETAEDVKITAVDQDLDALNAAKENLSEFGNRVNFIHSNFANYQFPENTYDGILADLGVSSYHLDNPERGFSFRNAASLDMRMNQQQSLTAGDIINEWEEKELADIFFKYGEERLSRKIARRIVENRPFNTTTELANAIAYSVPPKYRYGRIHPATRVFQALRIAVNDELKVLETLIEKAPKALITGGKIAIISFHSLEDRIVKHGLRNLSLLRILTKKPIIATEEEIKENPRSRSAKLRIAERKNID
ncbi:16S rRNA (cytosine(1402)-N(4))-methyltransferase RsmH [Aphanizomenon flos-aquae NRERC-008]|uniref:Ribosomal RNA small subunit methyltransferase H n=1 Tax=Aphanizomenon flos-aquae FACHB-1249 TaxID=2692889 RepID=A0ABR8IS71_APHFL|nr:MULTISPECIES: 16S rRNA (cytosine(1402)-N(4))-methyltransferase RsmH [Aphanizomenon]MBD2390321.1 16S rRNA (cytosine(1402)-N(4))-methyltransferase RsmH [Aphanizomenon flos-aquae FACHB-1171]MBD2555604.1 16S rRNA (cytosine(1402)-N(4))-methyltransferase RsmH [Aphanizomenon flos-aquae FACHB-1290]MBD2631397.1 16S rRNA (cytosine(1402)-N(4))-methyltransferase RsmH [Aphanizomenon sp. FACHB-1399]MBD2642493.1 16S rRNA (cytosine(1402)-N(4))-methyltransferase RsmH [Aphanizomenon sp. FACHB-1401]MBD2655710